MSYYRPSTIEEAVEIMRGTKEILKPIAGCTDIGVAIEEGKFKEEDFIDLSYIDSMKNIASDGEYIYIGALVPHCDIVSSKLIKENASILSQACNSIGSPLIRNRATIGGNICHASPSGDSIPAIMALNGELLLVSKGNKRWILAQEFFRGPGKTVRREDEILTKIRFKPLKNTCFSVFYKLGQRKALACSKANMAFIVSVENNILKDVRIAMGAVAPTVIRGLKTENFLENKEINIKLIDEASKVIILEVNPIDDLRSTKNYRKNMMAVLLSKALNSLID